MAIIVLVMRHIFCRDRVLLLIKRVGLTAMDRNDDGLVRGYRRNGSGKSFSHYTASLVRFSLMIVSIRARSFRLVRRIRTFCVSPRCTRRRNSAISSRVDVML